VTPLPRPLGSLSAAAARHGGQLLSFADQILVSGVAFLALVALGRAGGLHELGLYALAVSVIAVMAALQEALVARPYVILLTRPADGSDPTRGAAALCLVLSAASAIALAALGLALRALSPETGALVLTLALAAPAMLLRDFARRHGFARLEVGAVVRLDAVAVAVQCALLLGLGAAGRLTAVTALLALAAGCGAGLVDYARSAARQAAPEPFRLALAAGRSWQIGRWIAAAYVALQMQGYSLHWLLAAALGAAATGAYAACVSVVALANPLVFGAINLMAPRSARAFGAGGHGGVRRQAARDAALLAALMGAFCLALAVAGDRALLAIYPDAVPEHGLLLTLGLASTAGALGVPASIALASAGRAAVVAVIAAGSALLVLGLAGALLPRFGVAGAAWGLLAAEALGAAARWAALVVLVPASPGEAPILTRRDESHEPEPTRA
jgi:O-antigen/teichoic acid export membrane protein